MSDFSIQCAVGARPKKPRDAVNINVTVSSFNSYKGSVSLSYSAVDDQGATDATSPGSSGVHVPSNGSVTQTVQITGTGTKGQRTFTATGTDGTTTKTGTTLY